MQYDHDTFLGKDKAQELKQMTRLEAKEKLA